jgi:hypothetical protein
MTLRRGFQSAFRAEISNLLQEVAPRREGTEKTHGRSAYRTGQRVQAEGRVLGAVHLNQARVTAMLGRTRTQPFRRAGWVFTRKAWRLMQVGSYR